MNPFDVYDVPDEVLGQLSDESTWDREDFGPNVSAEDDVDSQQDEVFRRFRAFPNV